MNSLFLYQSFNLGLLFLIVFSCIKYYSKGVNRLNNLWNYNRKFNLIVTILGYPLYKIIMIRFLSLIAIPVHIRTRIQHPTHHYATFPPDSSPKTPKKYI